jgi:hypothetical protein
MNPDRPIPDDLWQQIPPAAQAAIRALIQHQERRLADLQARLSSKALSSAYSTAKPGLRLPLGPPLLTERLPPSTRERIPTAVQSREHLLRGTEHAAEAGFSRVFCCLLPAERLGAGVFAGLPFPSGRPPTKPFHHRRLCQKLEGWERSIGFFLSDSATQCVHSTSSG